MLLAAIAMPVEAHATDSSPLVEFLLKPGEMNGFSPGRPQVFRSVAELEKAFEDTSSQAELKVMRYEAEGFLEAATARLHGTTERAARGTSSVSEFDSPIGARAEMKAELKEDLAPKALRKEGILRYFNLRRFKVPGVAGAAGYAFLPNQRSENDGLESGVAKALLVDGNCLFGVAVFSLTSKEVADPVIKGIQAVAKRGGGCGSPNSTADSGSA